MIWKGKEWLWQTCSLMWRDLGIREDVGDWRLDEARVRERQARQREGTIPNPERRSRGSVADDGVRRS